MLRIIQAMIQVTKGKIAQTYEINHAAKFM